MKSEPRRGVERMPSNIQECSVGDDIAKNKHTFKF